MTLFKKLPFEFWVILGSCLFIVFLSVNHFFFEYELLTYDLRFRLRPALDVSKDIVIVEIDDSTLKNLGTWPLPRDFHASLVQVLKESGARAIVFDMLFSEPTLHDDIFAQALKRAGNVYLAETIALPEARSLWSASIVSDRMQVDIAADLKQAAAGFGFINCFLDRDGKIRSIPAVIAYQGRMIPSLGLKVACDFLGLPWQRVVVKNGKVEIDRALTLPLVFSRAFLVNYPDIWVNSFTHHSYFEILKAYADQQKGVAPFFNLAKLNGKVCFVGLTATGTGDFRATPLEGMVPMVNLQASVFNSIINRVFIKDVGVVINAVICLLVFFLTLLMGLRLRPFKALVWSALFGAGFAMVAVLLFSMAGIWIYVFLPLVIILCTYTVVTLYRFFNEIKERQLIEKELEIARSIQKNFLPKDIQAFPGIAISAFMQPAKFVAGDLYDVVVLDDNKVGVLIGDVSGKGVPAALIMAQTITLFRIFSKEYAHPQEVIARMNNELYGKFEGRFVTCLYLIIDTDRKLVEVASAGHAPLFVLRASLHQVEDVALGAGLPLGVMDEAEYEHREFSLGAGDKVVIFTDGVSEGRNQEGKEFGLEAVQQVMKTKGDASGAELAEEIKKALFHFCLHAPQHDDITLLVLAQDS
ncbi:MAG: CHASE2 domain-containing protein [Candidatus Omnitrophica bacterium]|nr:CHASE2 domain-containing protein [Candidatus Omnitrophota bacterium]